MGWREIQLQYMKSNPDFERLIFPAEFKLLRNGADDSFVEGYANVFGNLDHNGDIVRPGAFKKTIRERVSRGLVPFLDSHQWDASHTIGTVIEAHEDQKGLRFRASISKAPSAQEVRQKMLEGHIRRLSIGFAPVRESYQRREDDLAPGSDDASLPAPASRRKSIVRHLHEVKLFEVSAVPIAANEAATIISVKTAVPFQDLPIGPRDREWESDGARRRLAQWAGGGDDDTTAMNWARYRRAFLWYDRENADRIEAYKLPIADVIDGEIIAIPRAVFSAAGAVHGARAAGSSSGLDLGGDEPAVMANIERYYDKMARQFDDDSIVAPWRRKSLDSIVLEARAMGACEPADVGAAVAELLSVLKAPDRSHLIEALRAAGQTGEDSLRRRASALGMELARRRSE